MAWQGDFLFTKHFKKLKNMYHDKTLEDLTLYELDENVYMVLSYVNDAKDFPKYCSREFRLMLLESDLVVNPWHYELTPKGKRTLKLLTDALKRNK